MGEPDGADVAANSWSCKQNSEDISEQENRQEYGANDDRMLTTPEPHRYCEGQEREENDRDRNLDPRGAHVKPRAFSFYLDTFF